MAGFRLVGDVGGVVSAIAVANNTNGGIDIAHDGTVVMNGSSSVMGNAGGGIYSAVIMNGFSSVSGNVANQGGGISGDWTAAVTLDD